MNDPSLTPALDAPAPSLDPSIAATLRDLVSDGTLDEAQAATVAARLSAATHLPPRPATRAARGGRLAEIAGYLGGALLLGAAALFLTSGWDDLTETSRVVILAALAVVLLVVGGLVARSSGLPVRDLGRQDDSARRRLVSFLWTFAAASAAGAAGLGAVHGWEAAAAGAVGLLVAAVAYAVVPSAVGQLGMWVASIALVTGLVAEIGDEPNSPAYGLVLVALGVTWVGLGLSGILRPRELALATGSALALFGAQLPVLDGDHQWVAYALTAGVAAAGFAGFLSTRSWSVLGVGVLATTLVVPEALHDWTNGSVSAAGSLLIAGLTLLGASAVGLRLRQEVS